MLYTTRPRHTTAAQSIMVYLAWILVALIVLHIVFPDGVTVIAEQWLAEQYAELGLP